MVQKTSINNYSIKILVNRLLKLSSNDAIVAKAPNGLDPVIWTAKDEERLDTALAAMAVKKAARKKSARNFSRINLLATLTTNQ